LYLLAISDYMGPVRGLCYTASMAGALFIPSIRMGVYCISCIFTYMFDYRCTLLKCIICNGSATIRPVPELAGIPFSGCPCMRA